jgi:hypothetical protein
LHRLLRPAVWRLRVSRPGRSRTELAWLPAVRAVPVGLRVRHAVGSGDLALRGEAALRIERSEGALLAPVARRQAGTPVWPRPGGSSGQQARALAMPTSLRRS